MDSVPALIAATAAIGFAGALFNPAVRAYLQKSGAEGNPPALAAKAQALPAPLIALRGSGCEAAAKLRDATAVVQRFSTTVLRVCSVVACYIEGR
ncbi:MAG: hypothetical protein ACRDSZ_00390 [Pseudonocardiaceae bacterium]